MAVSYKIRWITIGLLYIVSCTVAPLLYDHTLPVAFWSHDFSIDGEFGWFLRDLCYVNGLVFCTALAFIEDKNLRQPLAVIFITDAIREYIDLIVWNNEYSPYSLILNNALIAWAVIYLWYKIGKHDTAGGKA